MENIKKWFRQEKAKKMVDVLNDKGYTGIYCDNKEEAKAKILELIAEGSTIAVGGSVTLNQMGMIDAFRDGNYNFIDRFRQPNWEAETFAYRQGLHADVFVCGTSAITKNGEIVNTDSSGNRVAAMIYGPKKVIIVCGTNKIVNTIDDAFKRLKEIAPMNVKRLNHVTPCAQTGVCEECQCDGRMCNYTGIIHNGRKVKGRITVIIIPEDIGF